MRPLRSGRLRASPACASALRPCRYPAGRGAYHADRAPGRALRLLRPPVPGRAARRHATGHAVRAEHPHASPVPAPQPPCGLRAAQPDHGGTVRAEDLRGRHRQRVSPHGRPARGRTRGDRQGTPGCRCDRLRRDHDPPRRHHALALGLRLGPGRAARDRAAARQGGGRAGPGRASPRGLDLRPLCRPAGSGGRPSGVPRPCPARCAVRHRLWRQRRRPEDPRSVALDDPHRQATRRAARHHARPVSREGGTSPRRVARHARCTSRTGASCRRRSKPGGASSSSS